MGQNTNNDYDPTVVTLGPGQSVIDVVSFEEAFGEFSELRGRGRARRANRKAQRQKNRQTKRMTRINNRTERKLTRQAGRIAKKDTRVSARMNRKAMRHPAEENAGPGDEFETASNDAANSETENTPRVNPYLQDEENTGPVEQEQSSQEEEVETPQGRYEEESGQEEDGGGEVEEYDEEGSEFQGEATGRRKIHPGVMDVAKKIEWNKYKCAVLQKKLAQGGNQADIQAKIDKCKARIMQLEGILAGHSNARGGGRGGAAARRETKAAKRVARQELKQTRIAARQDKRGVRRGQTPVESELSPEISHDKIVIPAEEKGSRFNGTGLIGIDDRKDFDSPEMRLVEVKSGFDGKKLYDTPTKKILIGVGIAALLLVAARKAKLI